MNPLAWLTGTCKFATKITNIKSFHVITFLHHLMTLSQFYFVVPSPRQQKKRGGRSCTGKRVGEQEPSKRGQWTLVMPPPEGFAVHLRTPAMAVALREGQGNKNGSVREGKLMDVRQRCHKRQYVRQWRVEKRRQCDET